jgi:hypothetical protein
MWGYTPPYPNAHRWAFPHVHPAGLRLPGGSAAVQSHPSHAGGELPNPKRPGQAIGSVFVAMLFIMPRCIISESETDLFPLIVVNSKV